MDPFVGGHGSKTYLCMDPKQICGGTWIQNKFVGGHGSKTYLCIFRFSTSTKLEIKCYVQEFYASKP